MKRKILILLSLFSLSCVSFSQEDNRYLSFDLIYHNSDEHLTKSQKEVLQGYLDYLEGQELMVIFFNYSMSKASESISQKRVENLKQFINNKHNPITYREVDDQNFHYDFLHNLSEDFDALKVSVSYRNLIGREMEIPSFLEKEVLNDKNIRSTTEKNLKICDRDTFVVLRDGCFLKLNICDYEHFYSDIVFDLYNNQTKQAFKPIKDHNFQYLIGIYNISFRDDEELCFPATLNFIKPECLKKYEISVFSKNDNKIIPLNNLYDKSKQNVYSFNLNRKGGLYQVGFKKVGSPLEIKIQYTKRLQIIDAVLDYNCANIKYDILPSQNGIKQIKIPALVYEPYITVLAKSKKGKEYIINKKPISLLKGKGQLQNEQVKDKRNKKVELLIYKKLKLRKKDFKELI